MIEKKNIDRLFQEKFKDFEAEPAEHLWEGIKARLEEKKDRKVVPFWFKLAGVAATLLLGFLIFNGIQNRNNGDENRIVIEQNNTSNESVKTEGEYVNSENENPTDSVESQNADNDTMNSENSVSPNFSNRENTVANKEEQSVDLRVTAPGNSTQINDRNSDNDTRVANRNLKSDSRETANDVDKAQREAVVQQKSNNSISPDADAQKNRDQIAESNKALYPSEEKLRIENKTNITATEPDEIKKDTAAIATVVPNALEELLKEKETVTTNEPKLNRWQISSNVAPIYFSSNADGAPLDSKFENNTIDVKSSLAIGVGVRYALNKKLTMRAGVNTIGMEYNINDLVFTQNPNARALEHVDTNTKGAMLQIDSKTAGSLLAPTADAIPRKFESSLSQRTGYIEVPIELSYKVVDRKFGLEVIGGVSSLFLSENSVSLVSSGIEMEIGEANNLNSTHFSTNIGLGIKYDFFKSFQFNLEPMFKYQINKFTDSNNYKPYFFGLYTGVSYRF